MSKKICFFVTPIGAESSSERQNSDDVLEFLLEPVLSSEFEIVRVDKVDVAGNINSTIIDYLKTAELVIVDMSYHNPNVFYEYGYRHALDLPLIPIINRTITSVIPFDVYNVKTIFYTTQIRELETAKESLKNTVNNLKPAMESIDPSVQNPQHSQDLSVPFMNVNDKLDKIIDSVNKRNEDEFHRFAAAISKNTPQTKDMNTVIAEQLLKNPDTFSKMIELQEQHPDFFKN